ncbi:uncharacterized protein LOC125496578 [Beta vulgaris subsp. vulgaris]|uniref:uncharacterized protein LOC125496578 n=1 Tax=Beta vulgaris subsp. vulgaris TaxID=3555 RepID=UPI0025466461|nr:uncharacterized protein LOC125496578 [Beta vulgaris subsp. vulgaris]
MGRFKGGYEKPVYPQSLQLQMESEFIHLRQRGMSVLEYAVKFNELARFAPDLVSTDRQRMNRFEGGLNLDLQERLAANISKSYQELYDRAINVERKMKLRKDVYENGKRKGKGQEVSISNAFKKQNTGFSETTMVRDGPYGQELPGCGKEEREHNNRVPVQRNNSQNYGYGRNASNNANRNPPRGPPQAGRVFMMQKEEAEADDTVITGTFPVNSVPAYVLFDSGASHSFISTAFSRSLNAKPCSEFSAMSVTIPNGESILCDVMYRNCPILIGGCEFQVDLIQFELTDFDVILGMNWLSKYKADINCLNHEITLRKPDGGHHGYLCSVVDLTKPEPSLSDIPIVCEYPDVFPEEIPGMPPEKK